jgi:nicotinamide mononucleotide transporter
LIEILGLLFGVLYIISMVKEKWYAWPFGLLAVGMYGFSCYQSNLFGELFLQLAYAILTLYGWLKWQKNSHNNFTITKLSNFQYTIAISSAISISLLSYVVLSMINSSLPVLDAITNGFAIVATFLAARKKIDNWLFWIPINAVTIFMMLHKEMPFYALLYLCYGVFAIIGYYQWYASLKKNQA